MPLLRHGHAPGHVRDAFLAAIEAYLEWQPGTPEPMVEYEVNYRPRLIPISQLCGLLWNCTDQLPNDAADSLCDLPTQPHTYAAAARAMKCEIKTQKALT
jgi:hypothetical protein